MKLSLQELKDYYQGLDKTIALNLRLLQQGIVEPEALAKELEQLQRLKKKIEKAIQAAQ
ncbi:MAG: hypothetical protein MI784_14660 [Cytophagales bacterium]|nr:hypothetical protein [Cytophagales bacterium]